MGLLVSDLGVSALKVCIITHYYPHKGGIIHYSIQLANSLADRGLSIFIISFRKMLFRALLPSPPHKTSQRLDFKKTIRVFKILEYYNPGSWMEAFLKIKRENPDLIHIQWVTTFFAPIYLFLLMMNKLFLKKPVILTCHNIIPHERRIFDKILSWPIYHLSDAFIVHAQENKKKLALLFYLRPEKIFPIHHGDYSFFEKYIGPSLTQAKKTLGVQNRKVLLFFGFIRPYKGLTYLLEALPRIVKEEKSAILLVVGEVWDKIEKYTQIIQRNQIEPFAKFFPFFVPDHKVALFFNAADIVVLPYEKVYQSGIIQIAYAFGKPVVSTSVGGVPEIVVDGKTGILVKPRSSEALARGILKLLKDKELRESLGRKGRKYSKRFTWFSISKKTSEVYEKILKN